MSKSLGTRLEIANLIAPVGVDPGTVGLVFLERQGTALQLSRQLEEQASKAAARAGETIDDLKPDAHPFLVDDEFARVCLETPGRLNLVQTALIQMSAKRKYPADQLDRFEKWVIDTDSDEEGVAWTPGFAGMREFLRGDEAAFDVVRVRLLAAAEANRRQEFNTAFSWVLGAGDAMPGITDTRQEALASLMLKSTMDYAMRVNLSTSMHILGNSGQAVVNPVVSPVT